MGDRNTWFSSQWPWIITYIFTFHLSHLPSRFPGRLLYWYLLRVLISWLGRWAIAGGVWRWKSLTDIKQSSKCLVFRLWSIFKVRAHRCLGPGWQEQEEVKWQGSWGIDNVPGSAQGWGDSNVGIIGIEGTWDWEPRAKENWGRLDQALYILPSSFLLYSFWFSWKLFLQWKDLNMLLEIKVSRFF